MHMNGQKGPIPATSLTRGQLTEVEELARACRKYDEGLEGALHTEPPRPDPGDETKTLYGSCHPFEGVVLADSF
jgi:hypothetical protein